MSAPQFVVINEAGDFFFNPDAQAIQNIQDIQELERNLKLDEKFTLYTSLQGEKYIVEAFDHPLKMTAFKFENGRILVSTKHDTCFEVNNLKWSLDDWDRFNGLTLSEAPFVLTDQAQQQLFDACDSFDDEGFVICGQYIATPPYYLPTLQIEKPDYWMDAYKLEPNPGWNLNDAAEAFKDMLPRLKLPKSRILVLGAGEGHDAALFARAGHVVTAVDFSKEGLNRGREKYKDLANLEFVEANIFDLPQEWNRSFDLVVEHTCFCAIPPEQRSELVKVWRKVLHDEGQLIGVFFAMDKRSGPPFGSTEWEIRKRTESSFQYLFWGRLRNSIPARLGRELFILAKKK
jgi:SAM-dependent methyltransferase